MTYQAVPEPERSSMARKPKNQPSTAAASALPAEKVAAMIETLAPARRGRKATAAASLPELPSTMDSGDMAADSVEAEMGVVDPIKAPGRKAVGPKAKPSAPAAVAAALQANAGGRRGPKPRKAKAEATPDPVEDGVSGSEALPHADSAASGNLAPPSAARDLSSDDAHQPLPGLNAPAPAKPGAYWDRATNAVQFDWPAIEQIASHEGPNQGMAKLLVAARAEGASSRWPL